jgi:hypothetical protein
MPQPALRERRVSKIDKCSSEPCTNQKRSEVILLATTRQAATTTIPGNNPREPCPVGKAASSSKYAKLSKAIIKTMTMMLKAVFRSARFILHLRSPLPGQAFSFLPALAPDGHLLALDLALAKGFDDAVGKVFGNLDE